ncbi:hypothetical protein Q8W40_15940 [Vibrio penaeicida]|uniref:hypothetical protein n=1 Tax=Vibrio penaeicida TaxID=104609 RepID=UPI00273606EE|nr:hypothetical protein [Vibrio penaeicida]MDP2573686.1 hypothetical protein [Vibrio penaeicida]
MELKTELEQWDGKDTDAISLIYQEHHFEPYFISQIIELMDEEEFASGSTWLLKCHFEQEEQLIDSEIDTIYGKLNSIEGWEARLHLLQVMPYMPISEQNKPNVESFVRHCLGDRNKFLRAWAYNALFVLSQQYPEYLVDVKRLFKIALRKEAPSIKARIKNILVQNKLENQTP